MSCIERWPWLHWTHDICWVLVFTWTNCTCILFMKAEFSEMCGIRFISKGFFWFLHHLLLYIFLLTSLFCFVLFFWGQTKLISLFSPNLSVIPLPQHIMLDSSTDLFFFGSFFYLSVMIFFYYSCRIICKKTGFAIKTLFNVTACFYYSFCKQCNKEIPASSPNVIIKRIIIYN